MDQQPESDLLLLVQAQAGRPQSQQQQQQQPLQPQSHTALSHPGNMYGLLVCFQPPCHSSFTAHSLRPEMHPSMLSPASATALPTLCSAMHISPPSRRLQHVQLAQQTTTPGPHLRTQPGASAVQLLSGAQSMCKGDLQERKVAADSLSGVAEDIRAALPLLARHSAGAQGQPQPLDGLRQALRAASDVRTLSATVHVTHLK